MADLSEQNFVTTVIRDPADRLVSCYRSHILRGGGGGSSWEAYIGTRPTVEEFIERILAVPDVDRDLHWRSYTNLLEGIKPKMALITVPLERIQELWPVARKLVRELPCLPNDKHNSSAKAPPTPIPDDLRLKVYREYEGSYELWRKAMEKRIVVH